MSRARTWLVGLVALAASMSLACDAKNCQSCESGCENGVATRCAVLTPPGCGSQTTKVFCPYGCSVSALGACNPKVGGAPTSCAASSAVPSVGALMVGRPAESAAVTVSTPEIGRVIVATSKGGACAASSAAGAAPGTGFTAAIDLSWGFPNSSGDAGTFTIGDDAEARLTVWSAGATSIDREPATAGTIEINLNQPEGGTMGSYDLIFSTGEEIGTFVAPACDICAVSI